jgi:hypothetical protein
MISSAFANDLLKLVFNGTSISGIADNSTTSPLASLYWTLHTADPGASGTQSTSEVTYTGWSRLAAARTAGGFTVSGVTMNPAATIEFGEMTGGTPQTATHLTIGTAASGAGKVLFRFALSPAISLNTNVTPRLRTTTTLTAVTS